jgi:hypothetical protein
MTEPDARNNRNSVFQKVIIYVIGAGLLATGTGLIRLYGEVREKTDISKNVDRIDAELKRIGNEQAQRTARIGAIEQSVAADAVLLHDIASDRDKRTVIIQNIYKKFEEIERRLDRLEGRRQ